MGSEKWHISLASKNNVQEIFILSICKILSIKIFKKINKKKDLSLTYLRLNDFQHFWGWRRRWGQCLHPVLLIYILVQGVLLFAFFSQPTNCLTDFVQSTAIVQTKPIDVKKDKTHLFWNTLYIWTFWIMTSVWKKKYKSHLYKFCPETVKELVREMWLIEICNTSKMYFNS